MMPPTSAPGLNTWPRHSRHSCRDQQPALGLGRLDLCHARLQLRRCHRPERARQARRGTIGQRRSVGFKPDGTEIEQYSSRGGNTWGLDITSDGQVFFTQPTSGTVFFHVVLPEYVLAKGKIPGTNSYKGMMEHQKTYPPRLWP